jgi:NAD(P)-dependent dehydrogenase (short-subunit alcohol dehydrogenase family)
VSTLNPIAWEHAFRDQTIVVTGASSGIGRATAIAFGAAGARVGLVARRRTELEAVATEIGTAGGRALVVPTDVTNRDAVSRAFDAVAAAFGPIDVVVNNAGVLIPSPVTTLRGEDLDAMLRVNLFGALFVMQEAVARMATRGGAIVNVASLAGRRGVTPLGGYCASKFALVGLTEALRTELHGSPVHVALVMPGVVETPMVDAAGQNPEFAELWPPALNMPPSWVVWAVFAAARFRLVEVSVPPGAATLEKLAALAPGAADTLLHWARTMSQWVATTTRRA